MQYRIFLASAEVVEARLDTLPPIDKRRPDPASRDAECGQSTHRLAFGRNRVGAKTGGIKSPGGHRPWKTLLRALQNVPHTAEHPWLAIEPGA